MTTKTERVINIVLYPDDPQELGPYWKARVRLSRQVGGTEDWIVKPDLPIRRLTDDEMIDAVVNVGRQHGVEVDPEEIRVDADSDWQSARWGEAVTQG